MFTTLLAGASAPPSALLTHVLAYFMAAAAAVMFLACSIPALNSSWGGDNTDRQVFLTVASVGAFGYAVFGVADELAGNPFSDVLLVYEHGMLLVFIAFLAFGLRATYYTTSRAPRFRFMSRTTALRFESFLVLVLVGGWGVSLGASSEVVEAVEIAGQLGFAMYGTVFGVAAVVDDGSVELELLLQHLLAVVFIVGVMAVVRVFGFGFIDIRYTQSMLDTFTVIWATFYASAAMRMFQLPTSVEETISVSTAD